MIGGNTLGSAGGVLGTCNGHDLVMEANGTSYMWLKTNGRLGIGVSSPAAQLDILASGTNAGLNVANSSGSLFNVAANGKVSIGSGSTNAQLDIFVPGTNAGFNISGNNGSVFSIANDGSTVIDGGSLTVYGNTSINGGGSLTIPSIANTTSGVSYSSVLVDNTGKLVSGSAVTGAAGSAWTIGGNSGIANGSGIFGTTDGSDLIFTAGGIATIGTPRMVIKSGTGYVGIGDPFVGASPNNVAALLDLGINTSVAAPSPIAIRDFNLSAGSNGWGQTLFEVTKDGIVSIGGNRPTNSSYLGGSTTSNGNKVLVTVNGAMVAKEIFVATTVAVWADYVFKKDYKLMPLEEVESYIVRNQHLPNVPSATEIGTKGQNLGDLQVKQMEKIEELTLYLIELNKKLEAVEEQNKKLSAELENLKNK
jgi:hypothetical protein